MANCEEFQGVSKCYIFKSRLQEYAQKLGIKIPVYETTKEGPPHEPSFRSTVIVNDVRYDSLDGFTHRKAAEQSAAEVALRELSKSGDAAQYISQPLHEIGLCKNLLQEYAQKMNFAVPVYECKTDFSSGKKPVYSCTVEIGGIRYIGAAATTKKEAEIKVARTALLALWLSSESSMGSVGPSELTVLPSRKRRPESEETSNKPKRKKVPFSRKKMLKRKLNEKNAVPGLESNESVKPMTAEAMPQDSVSKDVPRANKVSAENGQSTASDLTYGSNGSLDVGSVSLSFENTATPANEVNMVSAVEQMTAHENGQSTASDLTYGSNGSLDVGSVSLSFENTATPANEVNMVSAVEQMTAHENGQSTASDLTYGSNGSLDVGSVSLSFENTATLANEVNIVSAVEQMTAQTMPQDSLSEHIPHANNVNAECRLSTTSDFKAANRSCAVVESILRSCENTTTSTKEGNMVSAEPCLEASRVMPGPELPDQSQ